MNMNRLKPPVVTFMKCPSDQPFQCHDKHHLLPVWRSCGLQRSVKFVVRLIAHFKLKTLTTPSVPWFNTTGSFRSQSKPSVPENKPIWKCVPSYRRIICMLLSLWTRQLANILTYLQGLCLRTVGLVQKTCRSKSSSLTLIGNDATRHWLLTEIWW